MCVVTRDYPVEPVFKLPPLVCVEVLSRDDTLRSLQDRVDDYRGLGVSNIWIIDPVLRRAWVSVGRELVEVLTGVLEVPLSPIRIELAEIFAELE